MGRDKDGGDTRHLQLVVLVVPQEVTAVVVQGTKAVLGDPHDAKIMKRELEHFCKVAMELVVFP